MLAVTVGVMGAVRKIFQAVRKWGISYKYSRWHWNLTWDATEESKCNESINIDCYDLIQ